MESFSIIKKFAVFCLLVVVSLMTASFASAAITYFGSASTPTDGATATNTTNPTVVTPPSNMQVGDLVYVVGQSRSAYPTLSNSGGQIWSALGTGANTNIYLAYAWTRFDGTWDANPSFTMGGAVNNIVSMHVFRPTATTSRWSIDVAFTGSTFPNTASSVPITATTTKTASTVAVVTWATADDNTWATSSANWYMPASRQYRNTSGTPDASHAIAYRIFSTATSTGIATGTQVTLGPDLGYRSMVVFKETALPPTAIYRSVATGSASALTSDMGQTRTVSVTGSVANFPVAALPYNIGVGDALLIDTSNNDTIASNDTLLFIHGRIDANNYIVRTHTGATTTDIASNNTFAVYRAHIGLRNAINGVNNASIPIAFNSGQRDLVANDEQWNITCYASGTNSEISTTTIETGTWNQGPDNYLRIYTPYGLNEVGVSQRHDGKWDAGKYNIYVDSSGAWQGGIGIYEDYTRIDGLQMDFNGHSYDPVGAIGLNDYVQYAKISNNILKSNRNTNTMGVGINWGSTTYDAEMDIYNNIVYGFPETGMGGYNTGAIRIYNNTVYDCALGMSVGSVSVTNNIVMGCTEDIAQAGSAAGGYNNITSDNSTVGGNLIDSIVGVLPEDVFVEVTSQDFRLKQGYNQARGNGINLTNNSLLSFSTDINGQLRNATGTGWDIGADEGSIEFEATVKQTGGDFSSLSTWEDAIDCDLATNTTRVFAHSGINGSMLAGSAVTGQISGATAYIVFTNPGQILLRNIVGTFVSGETVQVSAGIFVVLTDYGNPASVVAKIDGTWTSEDTVPFIIDGWNTGADNYIRIYTTSLARHNGTWSDTKYRAVGYLNNLGFINSIEENVRIEGLQMSVDNDGGSWADAIDIGNSSQKYSDIRILNNIIKGINNDNGSAIWVENINGGMVKIWNNIIYDFTGTDIAYSSGVTLKTTSAVGYIYNNTLANGGVGISIATSTVIAKNNILKGFGNSNAYVGTFAAGTDYNATDGTDAIGTGSNNLTSRTFTYQDEADEDYRLYELDAGARNVGTSSLADLNLSFSTDIQSETRDSQWDIGADEYVDPAIIYRSVAPSATTAIATDTAHTKNVYIASSTAYFSAGLPDNVGVGDAVLVDTGGTGNAIDASDTLIFIRGRISSSTYLVQTHTGSSTANIGSSGSQNDTYAIYRAYTSLFNAEAGTENTSIPIAFSGGHQNIASTSKRWYFACYANGTTVDSTAVYWNGWTTDEDSYFKIYTPVSTDEVGVTQRHSGVWDTSKYILRANSPASDYYGMLYFDQMSYFRVEGLQIAMLSQGGNGAAVLQIGNPDATNGDIWISDNIIRGTSTGAYIYQAGIAMYFTTGITKNRVFNNIIYDFPVESNCIYHNSDSVAYVYNNTLYNSYYGIYNEVGTTIAINNIVASSTTGYVGTFSVSSNNIADDSTAPGINPRNNATVTFADVANRDFHILEQDASARNHGLDLTASFNTDIDGDLRTVAWDIGADEYMPPVPIFRSVGPGATSTLATDSGHSVTISVSNGVAVTSADGPLNIGVGDAVLIDTGGTNNTIDSSDTLLFIHGRIDGNHYTLRNDAGDIPADIATNDTFSVYRAYTSLANAESGTKNTSIPVSFTGGNRNLTLYREQWNIACYANGTTPDSAVVSFNGWVTGTSSNIKIYTPVETSEVGVSQRHGGKWDDSKYHLSVSEDDWASALSISDGFVEVQGLQITNAYQGAFNGGVHFTLDTNPGSYFKFDNNIVKSEYYGTSGGGSGVYGEGSFSIWNNIIYNFYIGIDNAYTSSGQRLIYNNTINNSGNIGIYIQGTEDIHSAIVNNIVQNSSSTDIQNDIDAGLISNFTYNLTSDNTAVGTGSKPNATVSFVSTAEGAEDFHLSAQEANARKSATNLTSDPYLAFSTDIDGNSRSAGGAWDIGADEMSIQIYRSVAPGEIYEIQQDWDSNLLSISGSVATFSENIFDNIGVGDVLVFDSNNDDTITSADKLLFISSRSSSTQYTLQTEYGLATTTTTSNNNTWEIYRAHASLSDAEDGVINPILSGSFNFASSVDRDFVANNEQWNYALYAKGTSSDEFQVGFGGRTTGPSNILKVYTPYLPTEVGISQRHNGKWDDTKYHLKIVCSTNYCRGIAIYDHYVQIDGLQIEYLPGSFTNEMNAIAMEPGVLENEIVISDNIIKSSTAVGTDGIGIGTTGGTPFNYLLTRIYNNIVYDFNETGIGFWNQSRSNLIYNNTVYGSGGTGIMGAWYQKNNIAVGNAQDYYGNLSSASTNNISADGTADDGNKANGITGVNASTLFVDVTSRDFHLKQTDTDARESGVNLTNDDVFPITTDIDGQTRNASGTGWDIGADEGTKEFAPNVMQSGGDYSTLNDWVTAIRTDLASSSVRVFSHGGITGTIADNATVVGQTSHATGTVVHVTRATSSSQILLENIQGIFVSGETVQVSGGNSVVISDNGNPASAVAKIDGAWTAPETNPVVITGWGTGNDNYVKLYTTPTARHNGVWDETKYRMEGNLDVEVWGEYAIIDGLQIFSRWGCGSGASIVIDSGAVAVASNNILKFEDTGNAGCTPSAYGVYVNDSVVGVYNNLIYDYIDETGQEGAGILTNLDYSIFAYNNTIVNSYIGILSTYNYDTHFKNNISYNNVDNYSGNFDTNSTNNLSGPSQSDAPGLNPVNNATLNFFDAANDNYHLVEEDTDAINAGVNLSTNPYLAFSTDIDGSTRGATFDIGADEYEYVTRIYRSVAPGMTDALTDDDAHNRTVRVSTSTAIFSYGGLPENMGVGDALIIDTAGTPNVIDSADTILFISGRTDNMNYTVQTELGEAPADISTDNDTYVVYRAYTSLANAEAGTKNTSIPMAFTGGNRDMVTNIEQWNIACYTNGTTVDTSAVTIDGWGTGIESYLKIYTPVSTSEVGVSQRHDGKWSEGGYKLETSFSTTDHTAIVINDNFVRVEGLQIRTITSGTLTGYIAGVYIDSLGDSGASDVQISKSILRNTITSGSVAYNNGIYMDGAWTAKISNSILYDFRGGTGGGGIISGDVGTPTLYAYNNTVDNGNYGYYRSTLGNYYVKNSIAQNCTDGFNGTFAGGSDYNISNLPADAPGANSKSTTTVSFVASSSDDFHLSLTDTTARNAGTNLSADSGLAITTDVDGAGRNASINAFDIGADETATPIYRSIAPGATDVLEDDNAHARTVTISGGVATFSVALADNIGVGDALIVDVSATGTVNTIEALDTIMFISGRSSSTVYTVQSQDGTIPSNFSANDTYSIYRAYTSLFNAEAGTKNASIPMTFNGGDRDIVASNEQWNIVAYANGTTVDTNSTDINGWNTGVQNYFKIYTPVAVSEVGVSQRHSGKWDDGKYSLVSDEWTWGTLSGVGNIVVDGLQIRNDNVDSYDQNAINTVGSLVISNNIITRGGSGGSDINGISVDIRNNGDNNIIFNNIVYNYDEGIVTWCGGDVLRCYIFNNTVINSSQNGIRAANWQDTSSYNNITQNCTDGFDGTFVGASNNISDIPGDAPGTNSATATVAFVDVAGNDFHLAQIDTAARDAGTSSVSSLAPGVAYDIDGHLRRSWDIGADEATKDFDTTVMETGGDFSTLSDWEASNNVDLVATSTAMFTCSTATGTIPVGSNIIGYTSGSTGSSTVMSTTTKKILLYNIKASSTRSIGNEFVLGEKLYIRSGATTTNYCIISSLGDPANAVAKIDGAWSAADTNEVAVYGWNTGANNYVKFYTTPTARHTGKWDDGKYRIMIGDFSGVSGIYLGENYAVIDGLQISLSNVNFAGGYGIGIDGDKFGSVNISNNIIKKINHSIYYSTGIYYNLSGENSKVVYIYNNIVYGFNDDESGGNIYLSAYGAAHINNNTVFGGRHGIRASVWGDLYVNNNISLFNIVDDDFFVDGSGAHMFYSNNISSDNTAPGTDSKSSTTVRFVDATNYDFHLDPTDTSALNAGTNTVSSLSLSGEGRGEVAVDIDGTPRGNAFDIGADEVPVEYVSTICESGASDCSVTPDYNTLATWEDKVESDISTSTTRVFSGIITGTLAENDTVTLYENATTTYITATVVATTAAGQILVDNITAPYNATSSNIIYIDGQKRLLYTASGSQWRKDVSNYFTVQGATSSDALGASAQVTARIDGSWASADSDNLAVWDWDVDSDNYVRIYTTTTARHNGKWNTSKYRLAAVTTEDQNVIEHNLNYIYIDGLQIDQQIERDFISGGIYSNVNNLNSRIDISNNIIRNTSGNTSGGAGVTLSGFDRNANYNLWNNIIYGFDDGIMGDKFGSNIKIIVYDNTIIDSSSTGMWIASDMWPVNTTIVVRNNIVQGLSTGYTLNDGSSYTNITSNNISSDASSPDVTFRNKIVQFISTSTKDFHLADNDLVAKNTGFDMSASSSLYSTDIDGAMRNPDNFGWDIGADEVPAKIYRSIAPAMTDALETGASNAVTISSTTKLATFTTALADNIGVGDVIVYNTTGTATSTAFISGRSSSTVYTVLTASGTAPTAISGDTTWSIYRAYTSLANAEAGIENTGIPAAVGNFDDWTAGGDATMDDVGKNLVSSTSNQQWNIVAYANGVTADGNAVEISGWKSGADNYLRIYTPILSNEVGVSQRHSGKWDDTKYKLVSSFGNNIVRDSYVKIDGLQISNGNEYSQAIYFEDSTNCNLNDTLIRGDVSSAIQSRGIYNSGTDNSVTNCIIYGFKKGESDGFDGITSPMGSLNVYNTTVADCHVGITNSFEQIRVLNTISVNNDLDYYGGFIAGSDYNISSDGSVPGANSKSTTTVAFVDVANNDFHLAQSDTAARDAGTSSVASLSSAEGGRGEVEFDIDGQLRTSWDIGADEGTKEFTPTVMQTGGDYSTLSSWEASVQTDLATNSTRVFSISSSTGIVTDNATVVGQTSHATGTVVHVSTSSMQILLENILGTFVSGETVQINASNKVVLSDNGNPASAVAKIDGGWSVADGSALAIDGWSTSLDNYIRIYTTTAARHRGKWDDSKYRLDHTGVYTLPVYEPFVVIDGLQINNARTANSENNGINGPDSNAHDEKIMNNIIKRTGNLTDGQAIGFADIFSINNIVVNNIVYGYPWGIFLRDGSIGSWIENNTVYNCNYGIRARDNSVRVVNNISLNSSVEDYSIVSSGSFHGSSSNNISSDSTAPGTNSKTGATVQFISTTAGSEDFHLVETDSTALNAGVDLSADPYFAFSTDIDGFTRSGSWDIGADEYELVTRLYRSVGAQVNDLSLGGKTVTVSANTATFSVDLPANVGVGDAVQYGSPLSIAFINGRISSSTFSVQSATGSIPVATTTASAAVYRSYPYLASWQAQNTGNVNPSINAGLRSQVLVGQNLVASNTMMLVSCYASTSADIYEASVTGWITSAGNYVKVYTPTSLGEVGTSQRHSGKWDTTKYRIEPTSDSGSALSITSFYTKIEGLQIANTTYSRDYANGLSLSDNGIYNAGGSAMSKNIIKNTQVGNNNHRGLYVGPVVSKDVYASNNIVYGFNNTSANCIAGDSDDIGTKVYFYNNTVYNCETGINAFSANRLIAVNNVSFNNTDDFAGTFTTIDYNASDDLDGTHAVDISPDSTESVSWSSTFVDYANTDFRMKDKYSVLHDTGMTITTVGDDIVGTSRPENYIYDIGAFEYNGYMPKYLIQPGQGGVKFQGTIKFD